MHIGVAAMKNGRCQKCLNTSVLGNVPVADLAQHMHNLETYVAVAVHPDAMMFRDVTMAPLRAWICEVCGFTEFYVENASKIGKAIDKAAAHTKSDKVRRHQPCRIDKPADDISH